MARGKGKRAGRAQQGEKSVSIFFEELAGIDGIYIMSNAYFSCVPPLFIIFAIFPFRKRETIKPAIVIRQRPPELSFIEINVDRNGNVNSILR